MSASAERSRTNPVKAVINGPIGGIAPWIAMSILAGEGRFELAVGVSLAMAVVVLAVGRLDGGSVKILEVADVTFFTALAIVGVLISSSTLDDLDHLSGEISNVALVLIAVGSMLLRQPFTLQYAREDVPREHWDDPAFVHANYVITAGWCVAFGIAVVAGAFGDFVLDESDNLWTGWVVQTGAMIVALQFTGWYRAVAQARAAPDRAAPAPPVSELLLGLAVWLIPAGALGLVLGACPTWVGIALIAAGAVATSALHRHRSNAVS